MYKIAVLGAGLQARGVAHYLLHDTRIRKFVCYDISFENLENIKPYLGSKGKIIQLDLSQQDALLHVLQEGNFDGVLNALPRSLLKETTKTIILSKIPGVDFGQATAEQFPMNDMAILMNTTYAPAEGVAPGLSTDKAWYFAYNYPIAPGKPINIKIFCGGIEQVAKGHLGHALYFSAEGLDYEYVEFPKVIKNGEPMWMHYLLPKEDISFDINGKNMTMETALTSDAFIPDTKLWPDVKNMFYATCRHKGFNHFHQVREAIRTMSQKERVKWLKKNLSVPGPDMIVLRIIVEKENFLIESELVDFADPKTGLSAMQRCTAFPATETLLQILDNPHKWPKGVIYHEPYINMEEMRKNLASHKLGFTIRVDPRP